MNQNTRGKVDAIAKNMGGRTYPIKKEVGELRKMRGSKPAEKLLANYRRMKNFSKASGTWGKKNQI